MPYETEILGASVVLLGQFNPAIFSPAWLAKTGVISEEEAAAAEKPVTHPQIAHISIEHLTIGVETGRFSVSVTSDPIVRVLDITVQLFRDLLSHTPLRAFGINYSEDWRVESFQKRLALGRALAPIGPWGAWGESLNSDDPDRTGGLLELVMKKPFAPEGDGATKMEGHQRVSIGPSSEIKDKYRSVSMSVNHHRELAPENSEGALRVIDLAEREFDGAIADAKKLIKHIQEFTEQLEC
jgi:hypothetical protein